MAGSTLPPAPGDVRGRQMGNYELLCRLSAGGMAEIFLGTRRGLAGFHKPVVLKKILPDIQGQEEFVQMFLDEARVTAAFNHPNIAQVFDLDVANGELFLAMEFVPGATLLEVARACGAAREAIPMGLTLATVRDTALALHYAHTFTDALGEPSPVIHRDVAEKNIMVTYEGVTKLLDFGIAKSLAAAPRTAAGMIKGTSGYMSPEQILGQPLDARSDLFSLGVVLHECLTGQRLFPGKMPAAVINAVLRAPIPEPSRVNRTIPPELDAIVLKALARKRDERYATTLEFARALERAVSPLFWLPEQSGELLRRLFSERREQLRSVLSGSRAPTGELKLAQLYPDRDAPAPPPPPPPPAPPPPAASRLPPISAPQFQPPRENVSEETDVVPVSYSLVTRPPAPPSGDPRAEAAPSPPPAPAEVTVLPRARSSSSPASARPPVSPEPTRAAPLEPARPRSASRVEVPVPPKAAPQDEDEPDIKTAVIRPRRPTSTGEQPVTAAPPPPARPSPTRPVRRPTVSELTTHPALPPVPMPRAAPLVPTAAPMPRAAPLTPTPPPKPREDDLPDYSTQPALRPQDDDGPDYRTLPVTLPVHPPSPPPVLRSSRVERPVERAPERPMERSVERAPERPVERPVERVARRVEVEEDDDGPDYRTVLQSSPLKPDADSEEDSEEDITRSNTVHPHASSPRWLLWGAGGLLLLLVIGLVLLVVQRRDGGLLSSWLLPPVPRAPAGRGTPPPAPTPSPSDPVPILPPGR